MTVCIAGLFKWNYALIGQPVDLGWAVLTASDRMITASGIEYEPQQLKVCFLNPRVVLLIAGDYALHSQAIKSTVEQLRARPAAKPYEIARLYGVAIQTLQRQAAEDKILAPLGLNTDTFLAQQRDMSDTFVATLTAQLQDFVGAEVETLVVGMESEFSNIYTVDSHGTVRCFNDVGFAAIGIGAWHAQSSLMQSGYVSNWSLVPALAAIYASKKAAEVAPGVGKSTDLHVIVKDQTFSLESRWPGMDAKLEELYTAFQQERAALSLKAMGQLNEFIDGKNAPPQPKESAEKQGEGSEPAGTEPSGSSAVT